MRPVLQTRFGEPEGNCTEAVIASLLHLDLAEVPELRLCVERGGTLPVGVNDVIDTFLTSRGYGRIVVPMNTRPWPWIAPGIVVAAGGKGPRGHGHLCVYRSTDGGFDLLHDPHPDGGGLIEVEDVWFIVPRSKSEDDRCRPAPEADRDRRPARLRGGRGLHRRRAARRGRGAGVPGRSDGVR